MNLEIKQLWIEALRSGKYKQGTNTLHVVKDNTFCCLGVLCDISGIGNWHIGNGWAYYATVNEKDAIFETGSLPWSVVKWADLDTNSPRVMDGRTLIHLNDITKLTFNEIADIIEETL